MTKRLTPSALRLDSWATVGQLAKHTLTFSLLTLTSRITGLVRVSAFAAVLGSGRFDDAYQLANTIPNIIYEFVMGGVLGAIMIPILVKAQEKYGRISREAWQTANLLLGYVGIFLASVSALAVVFAPQIVQLLTVFGRSSHAVESRELATYFFRFFAPQMFFYGLNAVFMAILNSHGVFGITAAAPIVNNVVVVVTLLLYRAELIGLRGLAIGTTSGIAAMALVQVPWLLRVGMPLRLCLRGKDPLLGTVVKLALPVVGVGMANLVATAARTNLLYAVGSGFTTYTFCFQLIMMPYGIFAVSIATVLYPRFAQAAARNDSREFHQVFREGTSWTTVILLPVSLLLCVLAEPIVRVLFERGQFTYANTRFTAQFLSIYAVSILPYSLVILATRGFYAWQDTVTPTWINVGGVVLSIAVMFGFYPRFGVLSVPLAAVVTYTVTTSVSYALLKKRFASDINSYGVGHFAKTALCGVFMAGALLVIRQVGLPVVDVLERGNRFPSHVSARYDAGGFILLQTREQLGQFWKLIARDDTPPPPVNFRTERVVAVFAPRGSTTATLSLARANLDEGQTSLSLVVRVHRSSVRSSTAIEEPAYMILHVRSPVTKVAVQFEIADTPLTRSLRRLFQLESLWLILFSTIVGSIVYVSAAWILKLPEIALLKSYVTRAWERIRCGRRDSLS